MKTINRSNYEEYFLLYADGELDAANKLAVEDFVQQNADLAVELEMLLQTKLVSEDIVFSDKENLLRTEGNSINEANYEEYFLLYIDNELSAAKREEVEMYVLQHPRLQEEFTGLKQAVLQPALINYSDKKTLYRTEKRRTVYLKSWRLAAAIFIGVCAIGVWLMKKAVETNTIADSYITQPQTKQNTVITKPVDSINHTLDKQQTIAQQPLPAKQNIIKSESPLVKKKNSIPKIKNNDEVAENKTSVQHEKQSHNAIKQNNIVKQSPQPVIEHKDVAVEDVPQTSLTLHDNTEKTINTLPQAEENNESNNNGYKLYNVAYKEINTDDDNSLHVGAFDLNKSKVKNLLKKAGRLLSNKNKSDNDDGKLQVANFEIQTIKQ